jgi:predicted O-methyltransferase YrrM
MIKQPKTILELGTSNGFSTFHLALNSDIRVFTIDVETARSDLAKQTLSEFKNIEFITERIETYIPRIDYMIDFLFIDANKPNYKKYLQLLEPYLSSGALVIADNIDSHKTTEKYAEYVLSSEKYITIHLSLDAGLLISTLL